MYDTDRTALLVMDVQAGIADYFTKSGDLLKRISMAISAAHAAHIPVIYAVVTFRKGYPEIIPDNKSFSGIRQYPAPAQQIPAAGLIHSVIAPQPTNSVVTQLCVSTFSGSYLDMI